MLYKQNIDNCFFGEKLLRKKFDANIDKISALKNDIKTYQNGRALEILESPKNNDLKELKYIADNIRRNFSALVIFGTGGSTLNPQTILALRPEFQQDFKIYFADNIDPIFTENLFASLDLKKTAFLAISKSGGTIETLAQTLFCIAKLEESGLQPGKSFFIISDPIKNIIRNIGEEIGATIIDHVANIGGRFSSFTNVMLLPALVAGLDVANFCDGALSVVDELFKPNHSAALEGSALALTAMETGLNISVLMPYIEGLKPFTAWVCQIWAESLGKNGYGSTPVSATGTLDQHSQLQLYLAGPADKLFTIIGIDNKKLGPKIHSRFSASQNMDYVEGKTFAEINMASQNGTVASIASNNRPVRVLTLSALNEASLGSLMMHFTIETILTAQALGINAFDQPAVEEGKILARKTLGQKS